MKKAISWLYKRIISYIRQYLGYIFVCVIVAIICAWTIVNWFEHKYNSYDFCGLTVGDILNYVAATFGAIATFILGIVAYKQNNRLHKMEDNNYIANNSCMVVIEEILLEKNFQNTVEYNKYAGQVLVECDNNSHNKSGFIIKMQLKKIDQSVMGIPFLIRISKFNLFVCDQNDLKILDTFDFNNDREGYTCVAILENGYRLECHMLMSKDKIESYLNKVLSCSNTIMIEMDLNIITDKYVMTKCRCRSYFTNSSNGDYIMYKSNNAMTFFLGHEITNRNNIKILS